MGVKLMTFRFSVSPGGFDDTALSEFIREREMVAFRELLFSVNEVPHQACIITHQDAVVPPAVLEAAREIPRTAAAATYEVDAPHGRRAPDHYSRDGLPEPTAGLSQSDRLLFNALREGRSKQAREDGVPPFLVLTNCHLLEVVSRRPESLTALGHLDGVGPGEIERYDMAILHALHVGVRSNAAISCKPMTSVA